MTPTEIILAIYNVVLMSAVGLVFVYFDRVRSRDGERWTAVLNQLGEAHADEMRRLANVKLTGTTEIPAAVRIPLKPDAEARANAQVRADTIASGAEKLKEMYMMQGLALSDEEALLQAESMLNGRAPSQPG